MNEDRKPVSKSCEGFVSECPICSTKLRPVTLEWYDREYLSAIKGKRQCDHNETFECFELDGCSGSKIRMGMSKEFEGYQVLKENSHNWII